MIPRLGVSAVHKLWASKWTWRVLAAVVALQIYFVRELIAVFVLFTIGFAVLAVVGLVIYLLEQAGERSVALAEPYARELAPKLREGVRAVEEISKKPFHRPRSETAL